MKFTSILILLCCLLISGCGQNKKSEPAQDNLLLQKAILSSKAWLDTVNPNPAELRRYGIKGKKKTVELFEAYLAIRDFLPADQRKSAEKRLQEIAQISQEKQFHNMASLDEEQFKEDSTSYLRFCFLLEKQGYNTRLYRAEIDNILRRLNEHALSRGPNQQMTFYRYYSHFNLKPPVSLDDAFKKGIIARRWDPAAMNNEEIYALTHEIFAVYEYSGKVNIDFFSEEDKIYLKEALVKLAERYIQADDPDLTAELISCMNFLKLENEPIYKKGLSYLLASQNQDGSFGNFEGLRYIYEDYVKEGYYLHTTSVVLKALKLGFENEKN